MNGPMIEPSSSRSTSSRRGFEGDSAITIVVRPGCTAAAIAPGTRAVDERDLDAEPLARALEERERAGVQLAGGDDVVARRAEREHGRGERAHPRGERHRVDLVGQAGTLELGDRLLERAHRRVGVATVELVGPHARGAAVRVVEAGRLPHARRPQRRSERRAAGVAARPDRRAGRLEVGAVGRHR